MLQVKVPGQRRVGKPKALTTGRFLGGADEAGRRLLLIRHKRLDWVYLATPILDRPGTSEPVDILGFRLEKFTGDGYSLEFDPRYPTGLRCECLGFERWGRCKHCTALSLAIRGGPEAVGYCHGADQEVPF